MYSARLFFPLVLLISLPVLAEYESEPTAPFAAPVADRPLLMEGNVPFPAPEDFNPVAARKLVEKYGVEKLVFIRRATFQSSHYYTDFIEGGVSDMALICEKLYKDMRDGSFDIKTTFHASRLINLGLEEDVDFCFEEDTTDTVPVYRDGIIQKL